MASADLTTKKPDAELVRLGELLRIADAAAGQAVAQIEALERSQGKLFSADRALADADHEAAHALHQLDACSDELSRLTRLIEATPARTVEGFRVKLDCLAISEGQEPDALIAGLEAGRQIDPPGPLVSLLRDIRAAGEVRA